MSRYVQIVALIPKWAETPVTNAKSHSHNPPPANSPIMHSRLVCKNPKKIPYAKKSLKQQKSDNV